MGHRYAGPDAPENDGNTQEPVTRDERFWVADDEESLVCFVCRPVHATSSKLEDAHKVEQGESLTCDGCGGTIKHKAS